jgi:hypothetical protein
VLAGLREGYERGERELERLEGTNVWGDVFCIGVGPATDGGTGRVGNINGLRLGKGGKGPAVSTRFFISFLS